ncbi:hypothetical protein K458DRAFT_450611 [Lentithecium fluviatile CBS 122367]|uniref:Uncharacterized protein n=1 Tax=Lentithecium fluviatile CBS 122367 TaxID=1168545 RepID=A0A6G1J2D9_9PLEO|nr:hypothetical protein K458DRAFT_450611 [Lentithecium fluviatile CBS 122367]
MRTTGRSSRPKWQKYTRMLHSLSQQPEQKMVIRVFSSRRIPSSPRSLWRSPTEQWRVYPSLPAEHVTTMAGIQMSRCGKGLGRIKSECYPTGQSISRRMSSCRPARQRIAVSAGRDLEGNMRCMASARERLTGMPWWRSSREKKLTFEADKLAALSGVAKTTGEWCTGQRYLAGLWEANLINSLLWRPHTSSRRTTEW